MRFVWAIAALVLATLMIGAGIAQRTVFQGDTTTKATIETTDDASYLLVDGGVLNTVEGTQTLRAQTEGSILMAYAPTADVKAWLSDVSYNATTVDDDGLVVTELVESETPSGNEPTNTPDRRGPEGSDLWLDEVKQDNVLITNLQLPAEMSVLLATDNGQSNAPASVSVTWPITSTTPWAGPLIAGGGVLMAVGLVLYVLGIRHARRSRGPRRKGLPSPATEPIDLSVDQVDKGVVSTSNRRSSSSGRRKLLAVPAIALSAVLFAGCSPDAWPQIGPTPTPTPTATVIVPEGQDDPVVTETQAARILERIAETVATSDSDLDADLAATRLDGAVLDERLTNYNLRASLPDQVPAPSAIPATPLTILLPQAYDGWPRTIMAVVEDDSDKSAHIMYVTQQDAWADYKLTYIGSLGASVEMPELAPAYVGASQVQPDSSFLLLAPDQLATAYADVIDYGVNSKFAALFEGEGDDFRTNVTGDRETRLAEFNSTASTTATTATLTFATVPGANDEVALATLQSGAIVAVNIYESDTVVPTTSDAVIKLESNPTVQALTGVSESATGVITTFSDQLFFYIPALNSSEKIRLLGYGSNILEAKVIE